MFVNEPNIKFRKNRSLSRDQENSSEYSKPKENDSSKRVVGKFYYSFDAVI